MVAIPMLEAERARTMTLEEWADMDEDDEGELVDGVLVEEEVPTNFHEYIVSWLMYALMSWAKPRGGHVFGSEHKLGLTTRRGRKPDLSMYAPGTKIDWRASLSRVPPMIVVEVISARPRDVRRDRLEKLHDYARFGVRYYWLIDPEARIVEILELGADGRYAIAAQGSAERMAVPGCEGLELDLADLWKGIDEDEETEGEKDPG
jgi:Uma2 family endonuclease